VPMRKVNFRRVVVLVVCVLSLGVPASARADITCPSQPMARVFLPWGDPAWYTTLPDGGMETRAGAWRLTEPAAFVEGNEPYYVRAPDDAWSLKMPAGSSATSAPVCIGLGHPTLRFFMRSSGGPTRSLVVFVEFTDLAGFARSGRIATLTSTAGWSPSPPIAIVANALAPLIGQNVRFRFESTDGDWRIDDVYVDPYGKG
jgi:hypothetical protein